MTEMAGRGCRGGTPSVLSTGIVAEYGAERR